MSQPKHWLMQTAKELLDDFNTKGNQRFAVLRLNIYFFNGEHVLLYHPRDSPAPGQPEEWTVPSESERIDRPQSHPQQQLATTLPLQTRVLNLLRRMGVNGTILRETQFMEFNKPSPLHLPDGEILTIWIILTVANAPFTPDARIKIINSLHPGAKFCWATRLDIATTIKTPASDTDKTSQLHRLDIENAFDRLKLCAKDAQYFERQAPQHEQFVHKNEVFPPIQIACSNLLSSLIENRASTSQQPDSLRQGMILLSTTSHIPHLAVRHLPPDQMNVQTWPVSLPVEKDQMYRAVGAYARGQISLKQGEEGVEWGSVMMENGRLRVKWWN